MCKLAVISRTKEDHRLNVVSLQDQDQDQDRLHHLTVLTTVNLSRNRCD